MSIPIGFHTAYRAKEVPINLAMCKITRRTEHREITLDEFKKQKGYGDYKKYRQLAKA